MKMIDIHSHWGTRRGYTLRTIPKVGYRFIAAVDEIAPLPQRAPELSGTVLYEEITDVEIEVASGESPVLSPRALPASPRRKSASVLAGPCLIHGQLPSAYGCPVELLNGRLGLALVGHLDKAKAA